MPKVVLFSQFELPYHNIGSWTTLYNYYLESTDHKVDYVICPKPKKEISTVNYSIVKDKSILSKSKRKVLNKRYIAQLEAFEAIVDSKEKYIIQLVDNFGIVEDLNELLNGKYIRSNFYIQFFYHGFPPFYNNLKGKSFFNQIDEMVLLTHDSYKKHHSFYTALPCRFSVLHNGINKTAFYPLAKKEKEALKSAMKVEDKIVFVWCSQDRPKKGLDFILDVWKRVFKKRKDIALWVIGANREVSIDGVEFFGQIPNDQINKYYQASDVYLYPSLCMEGFGLTLIEALLTGNLCIASNNGGIPEVLNYGEYGELVERPNFINDWEGLIEKVLEEGYIENRLKGINIPKEKYSIETWSKELNHIIENAKLSLS